MDIKEKVRKLVEIELGFEDGYFFSSIDELIDYLSKLNRDDVKHLKYEEKIRVEAMNDIIQNIKKDLIQDRFSHLWKDDSPKDEYEKGVLNAIRLIQFRIHCIMD